MPVVARPWATCSSRDLPVSAESVVSGTDPARGGPQRIPRPADTRTGPPPAWASLSAHRRTPTVADIRGALAHGAAPEPPPPGSVTPLASAVLVPLYEHEGEVRLVLTRRAWHLRSHRGEVSFPGGRREPGDRSLWETALRETWEETALDTGAVERLGELDHLATVSSNSSIIPFVGLVPERPELHPNPDEVDAILHVPVSELLDPAVYRQERWALPGVERPIHFFDLVGDTIWGATASMLVDLLGRITRTR